MGDINRRREPKKKLKTLKVPPERVGPNNDLQKSTFEPHEGMYLDKKEIKKQNMAGLKKRIAKIGLPPPINAPQAVKQKGLNKIQTNKRNKLLKNMGKAAIGGAIAGTMTSIGLGTSKEKQSKLRKADQQDINRVKRWDSRSFNKKKERAGTTEPVFFIEKSREIQLNKQKGTYPASDLSGKPMPGMKGDELTAKLRNRIAKVRKANGGVAPNYNNPSKVRKKKTATKAAARSAVNKGVNKVNPIKPTKTYKDTINIKEEDPKRIEQNATTIGRNPTYTGKARKRIARIRNAGEQVDPRVKKRKTVRPDSPVQKVSQMKDRIAELKTAKEHSHSIAFRKHEGQYYRRASLSKQEGKYAKYWLLNAKQTNGNGWGVSPVSIAKNINKFIGRPFVITAKQWVAESEYGDQFEHPYLPTNNIDNIISHQEKFRVGSIVDVVEKDGDYHAVIEMNSKFANMMLPPFCSPAIFQNNPGEADGEISDWEALHLAGLMEDPAYGARIALLKGSCMGTAEACSIQFKAAKQTTMCPKKKAKLVRRIDRLGD
jgi:hypothetical protein